MTGATAENNGKSGLVPEPTSEKHKAFLRGDGIWDFPTKEDIGLSDVPNTSTDNQKPTFSQAETRENIESDETLSTILGKIKKYFFDLRDVAFSGSYNDLSDIPTIPVVNDATFTIQRNGEDIGAFSANQDTDDSVDITVPTKVSELENDSGFKTTDTDTWKSNTKENEGYVEKGEGHVNQVWGTDENGNPGWRNEKDTTYGNMVGATASSDGSSGLVPGANAGEENKFLRGDGTWDTPSGTNESSLVNLIYPVGSIYMSVNSVNPSNLFAGTSWEAWGAGRVPVGVGGSEVEFQNVESTGGVMKTNWSHYHTTNSHSHTVNSHNHQVDSHTHTVNNHSHSIDAHSHSINAHSHTVNSHKHISTFGFDNVSYYTQQKYGSVYVSTPTDGWALSATSSKSGGTAMGYTSPESPNTDAKSLQTNGTSLTTGGSAPSTSSAAPYTTESTPGTSASSPNTDISGQEETNLQPYITCYMWKRTA